MIRRNDLLQHGKTRRFLIDVGFNNSAATGCREHGSSAVHWWSNGGTGRHGRTRLLGVKTGHRWRPGCHFALILIRGRCRVDLMDVAGWHSWWLVHVRLMLLLLLILMLLNLLLTKHDRTVAGLMMMWGVTRGASSKCLMVESSKVMVTAQIGVVKVGRRCVIIAASVIAVVCCIVVGRLVVDTWGRGAILGVLVTGRVVAETCMGRVMLLLLLLLFDDADFSVFKRRTGAILESRFESRLAMLLLLTLGTLLISFHVTRRRIRWQVTSVMLAAAVALVSCHRRRTLDATVAGQVQHQIRRRAECWRRIVGRFVTRSRIGQMTAERRRRRWRHGVGE